MRFFLTILLCFIVAFQSSAVVHAFPALCPMHHGGEPSASSGEPAQATGDCCNDAETAAKTGKLCKTDTPCGSSSACVLPSFYTHIPLVQAANPVFALNAPITTVDPSGIWRPPSLS